MPQASFQRSWSTIARTCAISSSVEAARTRSSPAARKRAPACEVAGGRPELAERAGAAEIGIRLEPDGVAVRLDEVAARGGSGLGRASCARARAGRAPAPAAPPPTCRRPRARRPRRGARTRGSSSATTSRARAPAPRRPCRRAAPRGSAPASSPRSRRAARAGARRSARASARASGRARSRGDTRVSGSSSESSPASRSWRTQTAVNVFVIEPIRYCVSGVASVLASTSARPSASCHRSSPARKTAALTDGIRCSA